MLEPALLAAGLSHWEFGRFEVYRVNPPLVRMVAALPVLAAGYEEDWSEFYESSGGRPEYALGNSFIAANGERSLWLMTIARWACIPFSLIGGFFAFKYSQEIWRSDAAGFLTLVIWCFEPNILAHAELITNDVACTSFGLGATWTFWRWLQAPSWSRAAVAGLLLGLAQLSKSSWLILFALWPVLAVLWWTTELRISRRSIQRSLPASHAPLRAISLLHPARLLGHLAVILGLGLYLLNLGYAFEGSFTPLKEFDFISHSLTGLDKPKAVGNRFRGSWIGEVPIPFPKQYVLGIDSQKYDFESWPRPSYLRGEWKQGGWLYYYLYGLCVKVPHGVQLLVLMALLQPLWSLIQRRFASTECSSTPTTTALDQLVLIAPGLAIFILASSQTKMNEHFRYVLPTIGTCTVILGRAVFWGKSSKSKLPPGQPALGLSRVL